MDQIPTDVEHEEDPIMDKVPVVDEHQEDPIEAPEDNADLPPRAQTAKRQRTDVDAVFQTLRTRTSPKPLVNVIDKMTLRQRMVASEMGFGDTLSMTFDEIPGLLAYFVVDHLDTVDMCIRTPSGNIPINRHSVHNVLGFPLGTVYIVDQQKAYYDDKVSLMWKRHMELPGGSVRAKHVAEKIEQDRDAGYMFKLDFLVLLVTTMVGGTKYGTVNQRFLPSITHDCNVKELDWCRYVVDAVRTCKDGWMPNNKNAYFIGPVTYLVVRILLHFYIYVNIRISPVVIQI